VSTFVKEEDAMKHLRSNGSAGSAIVVAVALLAGGAVWCRSRIRQIADIHRDDAQTIALLAAMQPDLILTDNYISMVLYTQAPALYARLQEIGPGTYYGWRKNEVPPAIVEAIAGAGSSRPTNSILVVLFPHELGRTDTYEGFGQRYPLWNALIEEHFQLAELVESEHVEGRLYLRK